MLSLQRRLSYIIYLANSLQTNLLFFPLTVEQIYSSQQIYKLKNIMRRLISDHNYSLSLNGHTDGKDTRQQRINIDFLIWTIKMA